MWYNMSTEEIQRLEIQTDENGVPEVSCFMKDLQLFLKVTYRTITLFEMYHNNNIKKRSHFNKFKLFIFFAETWR